MPGRRAVLILSNDPFAAALLGLLAERTGHAAGFAEAEERPEDAIARVPRASIVLLDASLPAAQSDLFFGLAARRKMGLAIFWHPQNGQVPAPSAIERDVPFFRVPTDVDQFTRIVEAASASNWFRSGGDRRSPLIEQQEGTLVFVDRSGERYRVYDRRSGGGGGDRRSGNRRIFVDIAGTEWSYSLQEAGDDLTPTALERQLARATRLPQMEEKDS